MKIRQMKKIPIPRSDRADLIHKYPALRTYPQYWAVLLGLLTNQPTRSGKGTSISHSYLLHMLGITRPSSLRSGELLNAFARDVLPEIEISSYRRGESRGVSNIHLPDEVLEMFTKRHPDNERGIVDAVTGNDWRPSMRKENERAVDAEMGRIRFHRLGQKVIGDYHSTELRTPSVSRMFNRNRDNAWNAFGEYVDVRNLGLIDKARIATMMNQLNYSPLPRYTKSSNKNSWRLVPHGVSILSIPRVVREAWLKGSFQVDLVSSHLILSVQLFQRYNHLSVGSRAALKRVEKWLFDGGVIWDEFALEFKELAKKGLYGVLYGMSRGNLTKTLGSFSNEFFNHWIVKALWEVRKELVDAAYLGKLEMHHPVTNEQLLRVSIGRDGRKLVNFGSAASIIAQTFETLIISSVYDTWAFGYEHWFTPILYAYDGVGMIVRRKREIERTRKLVLNDIQERANDWGLWVRPEWRAL